MDNLQAHISSKKQAAAAADILPPSTVAITVPHEFEPSLTLSPSTLAITVPQEFEPSLI